MLKYKLEGKLIIFMKNKMDSRFVKIKLKI